MIVCRFLKIKSVLSIAPMRKKLMAAVLLPTPLKLYGREFGGGGGRLALPHHFITWQLHFHWVTFMTIKGGEYDPNLNLCTVVVFFNSTREPSQYNVRPLGY